MLAIAALRSSKHNYQHEQLPAEMFQSGAYVSRHPSFVLVPLMAAARSWAARVINRESTHDPYDLNPELLCYRRHFAGARTPRAGSDAKF
jgi:hypothetical protein